MAKNRQYAGPHEAADLQVADGLYVTVLNQEITDEQALTLGYTLDAEDGSGLIFARRTITVSDELDALLGEHEDWPRTGGTASDDKIVDDPSSNPSTAQTYVLIDGTEVTGPELNERVAIEADAQEAVERVAATADVTPNDVKGQRDAIERRIVEIDNRTAELNAAADAENIDDDDAASIVAELDELAAERTSLVNALGEVA